jgi:putative tricarboxylic transport membrane protein
MRLAELITAAILALLSIYLMVKSAELEIGYLPDEGPGGGAWPFWLAAIMLISCIVIMINWLKKATVPSRSTEPFLDDFAKKSLFKVSIGLLIFISLINIISMYGAMAVFLIYYVRSLGQHGWGLTIILSVGLPIIFFIFFEAAMRITLPKGMKFTEPFYNFLNTIIY